MIISKSSWHYKYIASTPVDTYYVHNLCKYMRYFFYATLWRAVVFGYWFIKPKTRVKRPPNPFIQAIKDKHNKLCRMVEYV